MKITELVEVKDVAYGLAWSYYYGYLTIIMPELRARARKSEYARKGPKLLLKFVTILPTSGICPEEMCCIDSNIDYLGAIKYNVDRAGNKSRDYKHSVHRVTHPDDPLQVCLFTLSLCISFPSCWIICYYFFYYLILCYYYQYL